MTNQRKMLIFCATQDMVDYMTPLLASVLSQKDTIEESSDEENEEKNEEKQNDFKIRSNIHFFRLHGNMTQKVHSAWDNYFSHLSCLWHIYFILQNSAGHCFNNCVCICHCCRTGQRFSKLFGILMLAFCCARWVRLNFSPSFAAITGGLL